MHRLLCIAIAATATTATSFAAGQSTEERCDTGEHCVVASTLDEQWRGLGELPWLRLRAGLGFQLPAAYRHTANGKAAADHEDFLLLSVRGEIDAFGLVLVGGVRDHGPVSERAPRAPTTFDAARFYDVMIGFPLTRTRVLAVERHWWKRTIYLAHDEVRRESITPLLGLRVLSLRDSPPTPETPGVVACALQLGVRSRVEVGNGGYSAVEIETRAMYVPSTRSLAAQVSSRLQVGWYYFGPEFFVYGRQMSWLSLEAGVAIDL